MIGGTANKLVAVAMSALIVAMPLSPCARADRGEECSPQGVDTAIAPKILPAPAGTPYDDKSTDSVKPLEAVDIKSLKLKSPGVLTVATQNDGAPSTCMNSKGRFTGFDNDLLRAMAAYLHLTVDFRAIKLGDIVSRVASGEFDLGSGSLTATDSRRQSVDFTNGYDFGYNTLVVSRNSTITGFDDLSGKRVGVQQSSAQGEYVTGTLNLQPVLFPDFSAAYASLTTRQIDAWVAPERQARRAVQPDDPTVIAGSVPLNRFVAWPVAKNNQPLIDALNSALDAVIADGTWARLFQAWVPRPLPNGWRPGSKAAAPPQLEDLSALAEKNMPKTSPPEPVSRSSAGQFVELLKTGLPNTLVLSVAASVIALMVGLALAFMGNSRSRWLRWPFRVYVEIITGLPEVLVVLLVGIGMARILDGRTGYAPYVCAIVALGVMAAAYVGPVLRRGLSEVEGRELAALPQVVQREIRPLLEQFIWLLRASALVYFLGLVGGQRELLGVGIGLTGSVDSLVALLAAALCYLVLTIPLTHLVKLVGPRRQLETV